ncbi:FxSxx-COOH system tetratricopeptide repeat protein [Paractinoplanes hotanensis]|uniref:FxSxx-COOH system tetratricopeptide repeat protein n=1 Tax=Paractinoplanes hotanensis TaxID=2906497 RepID=A0ABT0XQA9_9ACTN|nr:FxSxx-COOH system tetratricopeptide repeat protein [Actinoplanes hotanensis]MCM4075967.1 FxSxx-COOH system tetratricopeptide repeat protein [Actinoplanes hotanensis]
MSEDGRETFFVSYTAANRPWAEWVSWKLEEVGHRAIVQAWDFRPGENFVDRMRAALESADRTIAVVSPAYLASRYCTDEWTGAFMEDEEGRRRLVLVQIEECVLPRLLAPIVRIELFGADQDQARSRLLDGLRLGRAKPSHQPPFPGASRSRPFPGSRPAICNLQPRNPHFTGRRDLLDELRSRLHVSDSPILIQAVHGLGGIGKTQLALEYAHRFMVDYAAIWWVIADQPATMVTQLTELARRLGILDARPEELIEVLFRRLDQTGRWLLVLDNAETAEDLRDLIRPGGHTIITSRNPDWRAVGATPVQLGVLEQYESVAFMAKRSPSVSTTSAERLADRMDGLPLALAQAAAFIDNAQISGEDYEELLDAQPVELLREQMPGPYPDSLASTWELSLEQIKREQPLAEALMTLCAVTAPDRIPRRLLPRAAVHLPEPLRSGLADPLAYAKAVAVLRGLSLVSATEDELSVHRLMQDVAWHRLAEGQRDALVGGLVRWLRHLDRDGPDGSALRPELLTHVLAIVAHAECSGVEPAATVWLLDRAGRLLHRQGQPLQAQQVFDRALALAGGQEFPDSVSVADMRSHLGAVLHDLGRNKQARVEYAASLVSLEATFGSEDVRVAEALNSLGRLLQEDGDLTGAQARLTRALRIAEVVLPAEHPMLSRIVGNLGRVSQDLGDMRKARVEYERALSITLAAYGPGDPRTALRRNNLAGALQYLGLLKEARNELVQALEILDLSYGDENPRTVATRANYAGVLHDLGDLEGARDAYQRALVVLDRDEEANRPRIADACAGLGTVLSYLGDRGGARRLHDRALQLEETTLGPDHPRTATICGHFGISALRSGEAGYARQLFERGLVINERIYGRHHPRVAAIRCNLGIALHAAGDLPAAWEALLRALLDTENAYGDGHPRIAAICNNLAIVQHALGETPQAVKQAERALAVGGASRSPDHPRVKVLAVNLQRLRDVAAGLADASASTLEPMPVIVRTYQQAFVIDE